MKYALITILMLASVVSQAETVACIVQFGANKVERLISANETIQDVSGILVSAKSIHACTTTCVSSLFIQISVGDDFQFSQEAYNKEKGAGVPGVLTQGNYRGKHFLVHCAKPQVF